MSDTRPLSSVHLVVGLLAAALVVTTPIAAPAKDDCDALPRSALKTRPCNPRAECLANVVRDATGPAREARQRDCSRLPTAGVCHGPERYDPQAECRERDRRK